MKGLRQKYKMEKDKSRKSGTAKKKRWKYFSEIYAPLLRADVSKYRPEAYKSDKLKNPKKIHRVVLVELLSEI